MAELRVVPSDDGDRGDLGDVRPPGIGEPSGPSGQTSDAADDLLSRIRHELPGPPRWLLVAVGLLSLAQLVVVGPWLVARDPWALLEDATAGHLTRDGSLGLVIAVAGLLTVWRPRWALPSFLVASLALVAQAVAGVVDPSGDGSSGAVTSTAAGEIIHIPSIVLTCLIGLAAVPLAALGPTRDRVGAERR